MPLNGGMLLAWSQMEGATGYKLHMATEPGKHGTTIDAGPLHSYRAWTLTNGRTSYFAVSAYNSKGESKLSNQVQIVPSASGQ